MLIGLISGAMGPFSNAPIDTIKTRASFSSVIQPSWRGLMLRRPSHQVYKNHRLSLEPRHFNESSILHRKCGGKKGIVRSTRELHHGFYEWHPGKPWCLRCMNGLERWLRGSRKRWWTRATRNKRSLCIWIWYLMSYLHLHHFFSSCYFTSSAPPGLWIH